MHKISFVYIKLISTDIKTKIKFLLFITAVFFLLSSNTIAKENTNITPNVIDKTQDKNVEIIIASDDHPHFSNIKSRCSYYWPYYAGKIKKSNGQLLRKIECPRYAELLNLSKGYAPLGVFFRSKIMKPQSEIQSYYWEIRGPIVNTKAPLLAKFDSFNAAMVFEVAGKYKTSLQVTFKDGTQSKNNITITVWPRDKKTYYVDSKLGDDRFNGLSLLPDKTCSPNNSPIGLCAGPWKTATKAFSVLAPRDWRKKASKIYSAASICNAYSTKNIIRYPDGYYSLYKDSTSYQADALKDKNGNYLKKTKIKVCTSLSKIKKIQLKPGDQVFFKRGQSFNLETGIHTISKYKKKNNGQIFEYEKLTCHSLISTKHWSGNIGILFAAYGKGAVPLIKNTGESSCTFFNLLGVGLMHLSLQDLTFDLESSASPPYDNRSIFLFTLGQPINFIFNRVTVKRFLQGILFNDAHGMFISQSNFYDSKVVHLYSDTATDVAIMNNKFDYSGNHLAYTNMSNALVIGNTFTRQAFGRTALRISGSSLDKPTKSIWISNNHFEGWVDPRTKDSCITGRCPFADGKRYNYSLVEFHPNTPYEDKFSSKIVFKNNTLKNAENLLRVGAVHNLLIENNIFDTADNSGTARIKLHSNISRRPLKNVILRNNLFIERAVNINNKSSSIELAEYFKNNDNHEKISIIDNHFINNHSSCIVKLKNLKTKKVGCLLESVIKRSEFNEILTPSYITFSINKKIKTNSNKRLEEIIQNWKNSRNK